MKKIFFLIIFLFLFYVFTGYFHGLIDPDEPRYAATAKNMVTTGNYIVPYFNNHIRINKPPLTYWLISLSYKLFGINELTARLPQIISGFLIVLLGVFFCRNYKETFMLILISSPLYFYLGRYCNTDMIVSMFFTLSILFFYKYYKSDKKSFLILFFISFFLANLTKGPVALLIVLIILLFLVIEKELKKVMNIKFVLFTLISIISPVIYLFIVSLFDNSVDIYNLILRETSGRFLKGFRHPEPVYFYFKFFPLLFFPWAFIVLFKIRRVKHFWNDSDFNKLNILWFLVVLIFFSISRSKLLSYILPLSFPFAYIVASLTEDISFGLKIKNRYIFYLWGVLFLLLTGFVLYNGYNLPNFKILTGYLIFLIFMILFVVFEEKLLNKIAITNLFIFLTIFIIGVDVINQNKTEKFLENVNIKRNNEIVSFRRDITGTAFYLGNYKKIDKVKDLNFADSFYMILFKSDFRNYIKNNELTKIRESRNKIFLGNKIE